MDARLSLRRGLLLQVGFVWGFFMTAMTVIPATVANAEILYQDKKETISLNLQPYSQEFLYCSDGSYDPNKFLVTAYVSRQTKGFCKKIHTIRRSTGGSIVGLKRPACKFKNVRLDFIPWSEGALYDVCKKNGPGDAQLEKKLSFGLYDKKDRLVRAVEFGPVTAVVHCPTSVPEVPPSPGYISNSAMVECPIGEYCPPPQPPPSTRIPAVSYYRRDGPTCTVETNAGQMSSAIDLNRPAGLSALPRLRPVKDMRLARPAGLCDLSGDWVQRNTRTNEIHPLVWRIQRLVNEGSSEAWNYEVTRYKNGQRFSPPSSGRLYQSVKESLIFFDTPASMSRYNLSRIMALREVEVRPGCRVMDVRSIIDSWKGTRHPGRGLLVMERKGGRTGGPVPVPPRPGTELGQPAGSNIPQVQAPKPLPGWKPPKHLPPPVR